MGEKFKILGLFFLSLVATTVIAQEKEYLVISVDTSLFETYQYYKIKDEKDSIYKVLFPKDEANVINLIKGESIKAVLKPLNQFQISRSLWYRQTKEAFLMKGIRVLKSGESFYAFDYII